MTKLEDVARALRLDTDQRAWDALNEHSRAVWFEAARAAISALRDMPTNLLKSAAGEDRYIDPDDGIYIDQWEAVIDAILSEPPTSSKPLPSSSGPEMTQQQVEAMERDRT